MEVTVGTMGFDAFGGCCSKDPRGDEVCDFDCVIPIFLKLFTVVSPVKAVSPPWSRGSPAGFLEAEYLGYSNHVRRSRLSLSAPTDFIHRLGKGLGRLCRGYGGLG